MTVPKNHPACRDELRLYAHDNAIAEEEKKKTKSLKQTGTIFDIAKLKGGKLKGGKL